MSRRFTLLQWTVKQWHSAQITGYNVAIEVSEQETKTKLLWRFSIADSRDLCTNPFKIPYGATNVALLVRGPAMVLSVHRYSLFRGVHWDTSAGNFHPWSRTSSLSGYSSASYSWGHRIGPGIGSSKVRGAFLIPFKKALRIIPQIRRRNLPYISSIINYSLIIL
jgi:hypothetical protein